MAAVTDEDNRKVQTAVLGGSDSRHPVFLPYEKESAERLRRMHGADGFSCGVLLGGCGKLLTLRACDDKKSHFAHRPPVRCTRTARDESSADHLYIGEALVRWLRRQGRPNITVEYVRQKHARSDSIEIRFGPKKKRRLLHVQMARRSFTEWEEDGRRLGATPGRPSTIRMYGPGSELAPYELQVAGYALRFRCETQNGTREVFVGTHLPGHKIEWTILERCRLHDQGLLTPALEPTSEGIRLKGAVKPERSAAEAPASSAEEAEEPAKGTTVTAHGQRQAAPTSGPDGPTHSGGDPRTRVGTSHKAAPDARRDRLASRAKAATEALPPIATDLAGCFTAAGFELSLIGGSLRDVLLGKSPQDVDLATDADPRQALRVVRGWADELGDSHVSSGVVEAYKGGEDDRHRVRINTRMPRTRSRVESASGGRRERGLEAYLMRSGFTVDAMALELWSTTLVDPSGGLDDLDRRVLRTPGRPADSISADPLLMMRAAGHAARFGFEPTSELVATMTAMAKRITAVPAERVQEEFSALMLAARPGDGLRLFVDTGLADHILPELPALRMESAEHHRHKDIYEHTLAVLEQAVSLETEGPDLTLRLAALFHDIGTPRTRRTGPGGRVSFHHHEVVGAKMSRRRMRALKYPAQLIEDVARLVELHLRFHGYSTQEWTDPAVRRYVRDAGPLLDRLHKLTRADCTTRNRGKAAALARAYDALEERIERLAAEGAREALRPDLNGYQIMEILGIRPGAELGRAYEYLRKLRMEEGPKDFEAARAALLAWRAHRSR